MRLARVRPKTVNPVPSRHVLSPQRRRDAEVTAEKKQERAAKFSTDAQSPLMVGRTPGPGVPSGDDALVGLPGANETGLPGEKRVQGDPRGPGGPPHHFCGILSWFSALISASLRLCGESKFSRVR